MFHWGRRGGRTGCGCGVSDANRIDCEVMSDWRGADWGQCASQYAQTNHKQGFAAKNELLGALFAWKGDH